MANPIQYSELFAADVESGIKELNALASESNTVFQDLAKTLTTTTDRLTSSLKAENAELSKLRTNVDAVDVAQKGAADTLVKMATNVDQAATKTRNLKDQQEGLNKIYSVSNAEMERLDARAKALTKEYELMAASTDKNDTKLKSLSKEITQTVLAQNRLSTAMGNTKKVIDAAEGSYNKLNQELKQARAELAAMPNAVDKVTGAINKNNPAAVAMAKNINQLDTAVKKYDASLGNHQRNVGNYTSALGGVSNELSSLVGGYLSVATALGVISATFSMALKTDATRSALEFTFRSAEVADQKLQMLQKTADRLGLDFVALADSYKSFAGAAMASNFPISQTEKIFNAVANAGSRLKLTSDQMAGALMALQQMISKGNVQAEELRGQLGERIPGAFSIAARAMGVTEQQLNKLLKDGDVLASDLLPKLADELNKTFDGGTEARVDSLQGSVNRLKNTFSTLVSGNSNIAKFFAGFIDILTSVSDKIGKIVNASSWKEFFLRISSFGGTNGAVSEALADAENFKNTYKKPTATPETKIVKPVKELTEKELAAIKKQRDKEEKERLDAEKKKKAALKKIADDMQKGAEDMLKNLRAYGDAEVKDREDIAKRIQDINKKNVENFEINQKTFWQIIEKTAEKVKAGDAMAEDVAKNDEKRIADMIQILQDNSAIIGNLFGSEFGNLFSNLTTNLQNFLDGSENGFEEWAEVAKSAIGSIDEAFKQASAQRLHTLELEKQAQIDIAGTNSVARLKIEKEYNDRIRAEKKKQAQIDKTAAAFEIGINTAVAVSKTTAETGIFGIPLIPIIIALGALQLAAVLARPIPAFKHGTQSSPEGIAEVGEAGAEAIQSPSGHLRIAHKRQYTYLERGSKVFTAEETKRMLDIQQIDRTTDLHGSLTAKLQNAHRDGQISTMAAAFQSARISEDAIGKSVGREIAKLPFQSTTWDERGILKHIQTGNTKTTILNERYSLK